MSKLSIFKNLLSFEIVKFEKFLKFSKLEIYEIFLI